MNNNLVFNRYKNIDEFRELADRFDLSYESLLFDYNEAVVNSGKALTFDEFISGWNIIRRDEFETIQSGESCLYTYDGVRLVAEDTPYFNEEDNMSYIDCSLYNSQSHMTQIYSPGSLYFAPHPHKWWQRINGLQRRKGGKTNCQTVLITRTNQPQNFQMNLSTSSL